RRAPTIPPAPITRRLRRARSMISWAGCIASASGQTSDAGAERAKARFVSAHLGRDPERVMRFLRKSLTAAGLLLLAASNAAIAQPGAAGQGANPSSTTPPSTATGEWPAYGGNLANSKYSPLDQITGANFHSLKIAWRIKSPDAVVSMTTPEGGEVTASSRA